MIASVNAYSETITMHSKDVQTKDDFFRLAETIPEDNSYTHLMASRGAEDCMGFVDMWTNIFHTSKEEAERVARVVGLEPMTPEMTARLEDKILASFAEGAKASRQR